MIRHARAVVVGGGAVGCGIAYALARAGWRDIVLIERDDLTKGSTWHAAGLLPYFNMSYATTHIHDHSIKLYKSLEAETGQAVGFKVVGNLRMAQTQARMDEYRLYGTTAETVGVPHEWLTPAQIKERWPLVRTEDLVGALYHPTDGHIMPADVTMALAKGARQRGVEIIRKAQADAFIQRPDGGWIVTVSMMEDKGGRLVPTGEKFELHADVLVTASGNHAQRTARMLGIKIPAIPVEHQYIVTEPDPALVAWREAGNPEHPVLRDADAKWYVREERGGWILGPYEKNAPARFEFNVPDTFRDDLFQLDLDRIAVEYESFNHRIPSSTDCGLKDDYNGPICYTPDGNPLLGPAPGLKNMYLAEGFSFGITAAGGAGHYLAQLITQGEAEIDMWSIDPRRFGPWQTTEYAARKNEECYDHVFVLHHPDEERPACRPLRTAPCYDRVKAKGAQFQQISGWERPIYYADTPDFDDHAARSFRRGGWWRFSKAEAEATRAGVGLYDMTPFAKRVVKGPGAEKFLDWLTCNALPKAGRLNLTYALTEAKGTIRSEYTIARLGPDSFYVVGAGAAETYDNDDLMQSAAAKRDEFGWIDVQDVTTQYGVFVVTGPKSRELMQKLVYAEDPKAALSNKAFPWLSWRPLEMAMVPLRALRVSYAGELGWELHHPIEMQNRLFDALVAAGEPMGLKLCGSRALNWLRQEKSYRAFGSDLGRDATPFESGLHRFVDMSKEFRGKAALAAAPLRATCVTVLIDGPSDGDPWGKEAIYDASGTRKLGRLTSGGYSVAFGKSIGLAYVSPDAAAPGTKLKVKMQGALWNAEITVDSPYDTANARPRADG